MRSIVLIGDPCFFSFVLFCLASRVEWERWALSSPLSDMSPATSDCLEPYFSGVFFFYFPIIACVLTFLGPFISF